MKYKLYPPQAVYELGGRKNQEDSIFPALGTATPDDRLFIVCDGMGGHEHGEVASATVAQAMSEYISRNHRADEPFTDTILLDALAAAYTLLDARDTGGQRRMGTTLTLLYLHRGGVTAAHIGDSRIYHLRPATGEIRYISRDHSLVTDLFQAGEITRDEINTHPQKNVITRAIQPGSDMRVQPDIVHIADVRPGDYFYLCSDGMLEQMTDDRLLRLVADNTTDEEKREALVNATVLNLDNHSAYLVHVASVERELGDDALPDDEDTSRFNALNLFSRSESKAETSAPAKAEAEQAYDVIVVEPEPERPAAPRRSLLPIYFAAACLLALLAFAGYKFLYQPHTTEAPQDTTILQREAPNKSINSARPIPIATPPKNVNNGDGAGQQPQTPPKKPDKNTSSDKSADKQKDSTARKINAAVKEEIGKQKADKNEIGTKQADEIKEAEEKTEKKKKPEKQPQQGPDSPTQGTNLPKIEHISR